MKTPVFTCDADACEGDGEDEGMGGDGEAGDFLMVVNAVDDGCEAGGDAGDDDLACREAVMPLALTTPVGRRNFFLVLHETLHALGFVDDSFPLIMDIWTGKRRDWGEGKNVRVDTCQ